MTRAEVERLAANCEVEARLRAVRGGGADDELLAKLYRSWAGTLRELLAAWDALEKAEHILINDELQSVGKVLRDALPEDMR